MVHVYFTIIVVFGRFRDVAEASEQLKVSRRRGNLEASVSDQPLEALGTGTKWLVPEQGLVLRYQPWGIGTEGVIPVPN